MHDGYDEQVPCHLESLAPPDQAPEPIGARSRGTIVK